jgi:hypothetical protein
MGIGRASRVKMQRKEVEVAGAIDQARKRSGAALGCAQEKQKRRGNVLDVADFVRDVLDSYPEALRLHRQLPPSPSTF